MSIGGYNEMISLCNTDAYMSDDLRKRLADTVSAWMEAKGITVLALSNSTGLGRPTIYRLVKGEADSSIETLARVAKDLGTTPAALLEGRNPYYRSPANTRHDQPKDVPGRLGALEERVDLLTRAIARIARSSADAAEVAAEIEAQTRSHGTKRRGT